MEETDCKGHEGVLPYDNESKPLHFFKMNINRRELFRKLYSKGHYPTIVDYSDRVEESMLEMIGRSHAALSFDSQRELIAHSKSFVSRARKIWSKCRHFNSTNKHKGAVDDPYFDGDFTISNNLSRLDHISTNGSTKIPQF